MSPRRYRLGQREPLIADTRQRILSATREVLTTQDRLTVDAVASAADVSRMTVYNQFGSKSGLLDALFDALAERGGMRDLAGVFHIFDPGLAVDALVGTFCGFWASDRLVLRRLRAMAVLDAELGELLRRRDEWRRGALRRLLGLGVSEESLAVLFVLTSFEAFDAVAGEDDAPDEQACAVLMRAARRAASLPP
jgi:AcrR family transcriptional regulator